MVADFNGDGIPDLAFSAAIVSGPTAGIASALVMLGHADGTFTQSAGLAYRGGPLVVGDFNNDGIAGLVAGRRNSGNVTYTGYVFLGNGDGTFKQVGSVPGGVQAVAGDFNNDGNLDLAVVDSSNNVTVLVGNGDGTFTAAASLAAPGGAPQSIAAAGFDGDGMPDLAVVNNTGGSAAIPMNGSGPASTSVSFALTLGGTHDAAAMCGGDDNFAASTSTPAHIVMNAVPTTVSITASPNPTNYGGSVTLTAKLSPSSQTGASTDGGQIAFQASASPLGAGTLKSGVAALTTAALPVGA